MKISELKELPIDPDGIMLIAIDEHGPRKANTGMISLVRWNPVSQKPPTHKRDSFSIRAYLVVLASKEIGIAWYNASKDEWLDASQLARQRVTHWAHMPNLPPALR